MTLEAIRREVMDHLALAGVLPPSNERVDRAINNALGTLAEEIELLDEARFITRTTFTPAAGDAYIALPSDFLRVVGLQRTDLGTQPVDVAIIPPQQRNAASSYASPAIGGGSDAMYLENSRLYFADGLGAPGGILLTLIYRKVPADLSADSDTPSDIPTQYHALAAELAAVRLTPADNVALPRLVGSTNAQIEMMRKSLKRRRANTPMAIRIDW